MNLGAMRLELDSRFGDFISDTRANRLLNESYHDLLERASWPFLEVTTSGTAPLTIPDLRQVLSVADSATRTTLRHLDPRDVEDMDPGLVVTGTPMYFWLDGMTTLRVWPLNTSDTLNVRYLQLPADLALDADTPVFPSRYHMVIVDAAQIRALSEGPNPKPSDLDRLSALVPLYEQRVQRMLDSLLQRGLDAPDLVSTSSGAEDDSRGWY